MTVREAIMALSTYDGDAELVVDDGHDEHEVTFILRDGVVSIDITADFIGGGF